MNAQPILKTDAEGNVDSEDEDQAAMRDVEPTPVMEEAARGPEIPPPPAPHPTRRLKERGRVLPKPMLPTRADKEKHELTHLP